jgi:hypothetical protein
MPMSRLDRRERDEADIQRFYRPVARAAVGILPITAEMI